MLGKRRLASDSGSNAPVHDDRPDEPAVVDLETASEHVTGAVPRAHASDLAGAVRDSLVGGTYESVADVVVLDGDQVIGLVPIHVLLGADADADLEKLMDADPPLVAPGVDQEQAAWEMVRHGDSSLAVVDADRRFVGLIPPRRMLAVLLAEHEEDLARLGGFLATTEQARTTAEESIPRRLWHRLPWLVLGLGGAMAAAAIVGLFESELRQVVLLAFFVPGVVYMADAVGTQTEAVVIRAIALGLPAHRLAARELTTGAIVGMVIAVIFFPLGYLIWGDGRVAVAVALSLLASSAVASVVAFALPYALHRLGNDPAFGAGPLATVIQDLLSIAIYFALALAIVA